MYAERKNHLCVLLLILFDAREYALNLFLSSVLQFALRKKFYKFIQSSSLHFFCTSNKDAIQDDFALGAQSV